MKEEEIGLHTDLLQFTFLCRTDFFVVVVVGPSCCLLAFLSWKWGSPILGERIAYATVSRHYTCSVTRHSGSCTPASGIFEPCEEIDNLFRRANRTVAAEQQSPTLNLWTKIIITYNSSNLPAFITRKDSDHVLTIPADYRRDGQVLAVFGDCVMHFECGWSVNTFFF